MSRHRQGDYGQAVGRPTLKAEQRTDSHHKKVLRLHEGLTKRESALLVQMRIEKIGLNDFLSATRYSETSIDDTTSGPSSTSHS
jgi:hypothetical protein